MGDIDGDNKWSDPGAMTRYRLRCWVIFTGYIALQLVVVSGTKVRITA